MHRMRRGPRHRRPGERMPPQPSPTGAHREGAEAANLHASPAGQMRGQVLEQHLDRRLGVLVRERLTPPCQARDELRSGHRTSCARVSRPTPASCKRRCATRATRAFVANVPNPGMITRSQLASASPIVENTASSARSAATGTEKPGWPPARRVRICSWAEASAHARAPW